MNGLFENSLPLLLLGLLVTAGCAFGWLKTGRKQLLVGAFAGLLLAVAGVLLERLVVTDREQIERVIYAVAADIRAGRTEEALEHIDPQAEEQRQRARAELRLYKVSDISLKRPIEISVAPADQPTRGKAEFNVVVTGGDITGTITDQRVPRYLIVHFVKRDGRWYATDYEHLEPLHGMRTSSDNDSSP